VKLVETRTAVALESTLIAHGLPWPDNFATAIASEAALRAVGAAPKTIAVLDGVVQVGLDERQLERLARSDAVLKAGRRDLAWVVARRLSAATTAGATLWLARQHGLNIMATGGLGGVHREANQSFDISADLDDLAQADGTLVVCSGAKSILDLGATLEVLESKGVTVVGYQTNEFPAFLTVSSGLGIECRVDSVTEAAELVRAHRRLGLPGAVVLAQPPPAELALPGQEMEAVLAEALAQAKAQGISGKRLTPFLLGTMRTATAGRSLVVNKALIVANARLAGEIAVELARQGG
jgi:pseudouridine-5'-phosphate glycosidase